MTETHKLHIDQRWTLFLDRDGVINIEKASGYIENISELVLYDGVINTISVLSKMFKYIFIVTNQKGVAKGLYTTKEVDEIHNYICSEVEKSSGHIEKCYYSIDMENNAPMRKPNTGMALLAKEEYPDIDFDKSIMVGNNISDMLFGKQLNMKTILVENTITYDSLYATLIDTHCASLNTIPSLLIV